MGTALFVGPNALQGAFCSFGVLARKSTVGHAAFPFMISAIVRTRIHVFVVKTLHYYVCEFKRVYGK